MKKTIRIGIAVLLAGIAAIAVVVLLERVRAVPTGFATPNEAYNIPPIIAHKAAGAGAPGNTLEAVRRHLRSEIEALELDVQLSSDGVPVIFHATDLDVITTGHGVIASKSADELSRLRLVVDGQITEHSIPTLEQVFAAVGASKFLFLDIKEFGLWDTGMATALSDLIVRYDLNQTVIVESFNPFFLRRMRKTDVRVRLMFDYADDVVATTEESPGQLGKIPWVLKQEWFRGILCRWIRPDLLGPRSSVTPERLRAQTRRGYPLVVWTVGDPDQAAMLFANGAIAIQTNVPFELAGRLAGRIPRLIDDASRLNRTAVAGLIHVHSEEDIHRGLAHARSIGAKVAIAGRRHSMGGQAFGPDQIVLDMTPFKAMFLDPESGILTVQSGATWANVQQFLDFKGRSVKVMQSDTMFTVGGTLSVNAHGWQPRAGPAASTVRSFRLLLASDEVVACSREEHAELFSATLGGYGLLGVILDACLETVPNELYRKISRFFPTSDYPAMFRLHVAENPRAGLTYGRLSVETVNFLSEAGLHVYERVSPQPQTLPPMEEEEFVFLKRKIFRFSERGDAAKRIRWQVEKRVASLLESECTTRNTAMHPDVHLLWPENPDKRDILHEYFIPYSSFQPFVSELARAVRRHGQNLLNVTVRDVRRDGDTLLAYAKEDSFAFVLLFSQSATPEGESSMRELTRELIDLAVQLGGSFYLPYRLHYSLTQFHAAYPRANEFLAVKKRYDPEDFFSSWFYRHIDGRASSL